MVGSTFQVTGTALEKSGNLLLDISRSLKNSLDHQHRVTVIVSDYVQDIYIYDTRETSPTDDGEQSMSFLTGYPFNSNRSRTRSNYSSSSTNKLPVFELWGFRK